MTDARKSSVWWHAVIRGALAGAAGGIAWMIGIVLFFGPAQALLTDPERQSAQMLAAFTGDPGPRVQDAPWMLVAGLLVIGILWGWVYAWLSQQGAAWDAPWWARGAKFAAVGWVLMVPWFEFYLPWNVLHEPAPLVALEMACWAGVLLCVGLAIAGADHALRRVWPPARPFARTRA
jgi:hypothetical protein